MIRVAPKLARLRADRAVFDTVAKYVKDKHVREALSFHSLLVGGNPFETSSIYTLIHHLEREWGVWFPRGGTGALVAALVKLFGELGGKLRLSSPVRSIKVANGYHNVTTDSRADEQFDFVVSNADVHQTYAQLYAGERSARARRASWRRWTGRCRCTSSTSEPIAATPTGSRTTQCCSVRAIEATRRHLPWRQARRRFLAVPARAARHGSVDGTARPRRVYVLAPVPHLVMRRFGGETSPARMATRSSQRSRRSFQICASTSSCAPTSHRWTSRPSSAHTKGPRSVSRPRSARAPYFRPHNKDARIPGLYLVGAGTHPGAACPASSTVRRRRSSTSQKTTACARPRGCSWPRGCCSSTLALTPVAPAHLAREIIAQHSKKLRTRQHAAATARAR